MTLKHIPILMAALCAAATGLADGRLDVRDFGAKGDGVADDFPAIQRALDKAHAYLTRDRSRFGNGSDGCGAPEVFLPKGTYRTSRPLLARDVVTFVGEKGTTLSAATNVAVALYLENAFRCTVRNVVFRGGETHVAFWTANRDSAAVVVEDCRFENSANEAVWTEAWSQVSLATLKDVEAHQHEKKDVGPYDVTRDAEGLPVLTRPVRKNGGHNSTRFVFRHCDFLNCGGAWRGACDGMYFSNLRFHSTRPQVKPVFDGGNACCWRDVRIKATIPEGWPHAYVDAKGAAQIAFTRVRAESLTAHGAPLVTCLKRPSSEDIWSVACTYRFLECSADAASSPANALIVFKRVEPAVLSVIGCREAKGRKVDLFKFGEPVREASDLNRVVCNGEKVAPDHTHRWTIADNGREVTVNVPKLLEPCLEKPLPKKIGAAFPELDRPLPEPAAGPYDVLDAADFGLTLEAAGADEQVFLQKALDAAAEKPNPLVRLPGRSIYVSAPVVIPRKVRLVGDGRAIIRAPDRKTDLLRVAEGTAPLEISFDNVGFCTGNVALDAKGTGRILFRNGVFTLNRGLRVASEGGPLALTCVDVTQTLGFRFIDAAHTDVRLVDCWIEPILGHGETHPLMIRGGTLLCEQILGVPIVGDNPFKWERVKSLKEGENCFWILNDGGTARIRSFRFGGEFGGIPALDQRGSGKTFVEGGFMSWGNPSGNRIAFNNADPAGALVVDGLSFLGVGWAGCEPFGGVRPQTVEIRGCRFAKTAFDAE